MERFAENPDAVGWARFALFQATGLKGGPDAARPLLPAILSSRINFAAKIGCSLAVVSNLWQENRAEEVRDVLKSLQPHIEDWCRKVPHPDDFTITDCRYLSRIAQRAFGEDTPSCFLSVGEVPVGKVIAHASVEIAPLRAPILANKFTGQHRYLLEANLQDTGISFYALKDATVLVCGADIIVIDDADRITKFPHGPLPQFLERGILQWRENLKQRLSVPGVSLALFDQFAQKKNLCHWVVDWFPRLLLANKYGLHYDRIIGAFPLALDFERYTIGKVPQALEKFLCLQPQITHHFETLLIPDNVGDNLCHPAYNCDASIIREIRSALRDGKTSFAGERRRIYIPRRHSRYVVNDAELQDLLKRHEFETIDTDSLSFSDQIDAFCAASAVVAPHGAALTNLLVCEEGTPVLELFPKFGGSIAFFWISSILNLRYSCYVDDISTPGYEAPMRASPLFNDAPFLVDTKFVERWLSEEVV